MERKTEEISWWKLEEKKGVITLTNADPVRHGHWIQYATGNAFECSRCDLTISPRSILLFKYCPNCGAKMDR
jgi:hypothetical protein